MNVSVNVLHAEDEQDLLKMLESEKRKNRELERKLHKMSNRPKVAETEAEGEGYKGCFYRMFLQTTGVLVVIAAIAVLIATLVTPAFRIYGTSMTPTLKEGDVVLSVRTTNFDRGDLVAFYFNNKILVKRVIAFPGEWVDIDSDGNVTVNGTKLDEPYIEDQALGETDITFPYQVPSDRYFVLGDHRSTSIDSRNTTIGCISKEMIAGRLLFKVWPMNQFKAF
ncbi:MAG: signal peptidase I [Eubacterium sp.]|nr:signal peptidase I [Eubacterium sp.]